MWCYANTGNSNYPTAKELTEVDYPEYRITIWDTWFENSLLFDLALLELFLRFGVLSQSTVMIYYCVNRSYSTGQSHDRTLARSVFFLALAAAILLAFSAFAAAFAARAPPFLPVFGAFWIRVFCEAKLRYYFNEPPCFPTFMFSNSTDSVVLFENLFLGCLLHKSLEGKVLIMIAVLVSWRPKIKSAYWK